MNEEDIIVVGALPGAPAKSDAVTIDENENPLPKGAVLNDDGSVSLKLRSPVELVWKKPGEAETKVDRHEELVMRRLKGVDMMAITRAPKEEMAMTALARATGIQVHKFRHIFERMDAADIQTASGVVSYFLTNGPTTGPSD